MRIHNNYNNQFTTIVKPDISLIIPCYNEEEGIKECCIALDQYAKNCTYNIEIVFVDDGSFDNTIDILLEYHFLYVNNVKLIKLSKNYGSHAAIRAGIKNSSHDICTWLGSDLQEPLEIIEMAVDKLIEGYDVVYFERKSDNVPFFTKLFSRFYSYLMRRYVTETYTSKGIQNIVFNKKIKTYLNENIESNSSILLQIMNAGFKYVTLAADFKSRTKGVSKWTLSKKIKLLIDSFVAFSYIPIRVVSIVGIIMFIAGFFVGLIAIINKLVNSNVPMGYSTLISVLAIGFGITNISLGIIAEYLWRTYDSARKRPLYLIDDVFFLKGYDDNGKDKQ